MRNHLAAYSVPALLFTILFFISRTVAAQQVTGIWNGRIDGRKVELKIIQKGDSLTGTAYYYQGPQHYSQYRIRGYFDAVDNSVVWWDDELLDEKGSGLLHNGGDAMQSTADFNCPGSGRMFLQGNAKKKATPDVVAGSVALTNIETTHFPDVWDYVIDNYTIGANDPYVIDSVALVAFNPTTKPQVTAPVLREETPPQPPLVAAVPHTIEEKFKARKKTFNMELPISGDSLELRFYDNAEIDGDSISLFLNNQLLFEHVRLSDKAYTIKLPTTAFADTAELVMVAENLGSIPPNNSFMVALCGGKRYEARLASTENSSAYIRLRKTAP